MPLVLTRWLVACTYREINRRESQSHDDWEGCSSMVREEFIRHAERHIQDRPGLNQPAGSFDFRAESSPSPPPTPRHPREPPRAKWVGCVTQSRDEVMAWVRSNACVLLRSGGGFDKAVYQEMHAALRPLTSTNRCTGILLNAHNY